jgi:hypothetical protein
MKQPESPEFKLFTWWQKAAARGTLVHDWKSLVRESPVKDRKVLERVLAKLHDDAVIHYVDYQSSDMANGVGKIGVSGFFGSKDFQLRQEWVPKRGTKGLDQSVKAAKEGDTSSFEEKAKTVAKGDYSAFLNNSYLQIATNVLHDDFCKHGLTVSPDNTSDGSWFKVYGDNNMLQAGSAQGVRWSAETARRSRDSIYGTIRSGEVPADHSTKDIADRFPRWVTAKNGKKMTLETWHGEGGELWKYCDETSFPEASAFFAKGTVVGLTNMAPALSMDDVHPGDGFCGGGGRRAPRTPADPRSCGA